MSKKDQINFIANALESAHEFIKLAISGEVSRMSFAVLEVVDQAFKMADKLEAEELS